VRLGGNFQDGEVGIFHPVIVLDLELLEVFHGDLLFAGSATLVNAVLGGGGGGGEADDALHGEVGGIVFVPLEVEGPFQVIHLALTV